MTGVRIAIVVILAALVVFFSLMPIRAIFWLHPDYNSLTTDSSLRVVDVDAGGPAERAGIRVGDRVEAPTSLEDRLYLQDLRLPRPGQSLTVRVLGKNGSRLVNYKAHTEVPNTATIAYYFVGAVLDLIFVVVASILVLLRPSRMTWAFFIYCIATCPGLFFNSYAVSRVVRLRISRILRRSSVVRLRGVSDLLCARSERSSGGALALSRMDCRPACRFQFARLLRPHRLVHHRRDARRSHR